MADKTQFRTIETDEEELNTKIRKHRLKIIKIILLLLALAAVAALGIFFFQKLRKYNSYTVEKSVERQDTAGSQFLAYGNGFIKYSNDGAIYTDANDEVYWNQTYEMAKPTIDMCEDYLAIYDKKGTQIYIMTSQGLVSNIETTMTIEQVSIAAQGTVAVLMGDQSNSYLVVYDKNGKELVNGAIYGEDGGYPIAIALSNDAIKLAVSMLDINDGNVKTTIAFYNFGSVGENEIDRIVSANSFSDMVIPQLDFVSDDRMVAYGDSEIAIFEGTQKPKLAQEIPLTGEAKSIFNNNKYVGVVYSNNDEKLTHHVAVYDMHGFTVMEKDFSQEYTEIGFLSNNEVCILNDHSCDIYTVRGIYKFHYDFDEELYKVISGGTGLNYTIILENSTEKVRLK